MRYTLSPKSPDKHLFGVTLEIDAPDPSGQRLSMPAWIPGSYMIRDFARHVVTFQASGAEGRVAHEKLDKQTWRCAPTAGSLRVEYEVYAWDHSVRAAALDRTGGFCNGTSVFLRPLGLSDGPFEVTLARAGGSATWRAETAMAAVETDAAGFGRYRASDYDELVDHPIYLGELSTVDFAVGGVPHRVVLSCPVRLDEDRLRDDLARTCEQHVRLFGELPTDRYVFFMNVVGAGYGGLEHRASTALEVARDSLPVPHERNRREAYNELLGLCSHEYFHLWNVKRIRPAAFSAPDLGGEVYTTLLWAFEGITSYYDDLGLVRAGVLSRDAWLERLARMITRVHRGSGRHRQTLAQSSFDAWTRFYKADENAPNAIVSYYTKGALVALALDLTLRIRSENACSLDDVMRALWTRHGRTGVGLDEDGVERLAEHVSGLDLSDFFAQAVRSTHDVDLASMLASFGIELSWQPANPDNGFSPHLGAGFRDDGGFPRLQQVHEARAAQRAGLAPGDRVVAVDGVHLPPSGFAARLARLPTGVDLSVHVLRGDRLLSRSLVLDEAPLESCHLTWSDEPAADAEYRRRAWLGEPA